MMRLSGQGGRQLGKVGKVNRQTAGKQREKERKEERKDPAKFIFIPC